MDENPDKKATQQLTAGEEPGGSLLEKVKEGGTALKQRAIDEAKGYKDVQDTQLWKSIFRVSHDRSDPRNRSLAILNEHVRREKSTSKAGCPERLCKDRKSTRLNSSH